MHGDNGKFFCRSLLALVLIVVLVIVLLWSVRDWRRPAAVNREASPAALTAAGFSESWLVEFPGEAVPAWRSRGAPPMLVLLSADPFLEPLPKDTGAAEELFEMADQAELARKVRFAISDPVLLPTQTVRMALRGGVLSGLTWILPLPVVDQKPLDKEALRKWILSHSQFRDEEKSTLRVTSDGLVGLVEGRPFRATVLSEFNGEPGPSQLHVDLSYYQTLYRNEIKTPLYQLLQSSVQQLLQHLPGRQSVTISSATANGDVPMTLRFLGPTLKTLFAEPTFLQQGLNEEWNRRRDMLYLVNFQQIDKIVALAKSNVAALPDDATTHFDLYYAYKLQKNLPLADAALARACELDSGYGYEYRNLAVQALDRADSAAAIEYLRQALAIDGGNAFHKLDLARVLLDAGEVDGARTLLQELQALSWSKVYYPAMPSDLDALIDVTLTPKLPPSVQESAKQKPARPRGHVFQ